MLLHNFPNINTIRKLKGNATEGNNAWKNVVLNFRCEKTSRLNIESPYSLFLNKSGHSHCNVNGRTYRVETDHVLFAQPGDVYGLTIDNINKTEICNVHITKQFFEEVAYCRMSNDALLLSSPEGIIDNLLLQTQFFPKDKELKIVTDQLSHEITHEQKMFEATLADLVYLMICHNADVKREIELMPQARAAVRADIYRRLTIARDYLHSNYHRNPDLDEIAKEVAMSKYHFLRCFKQHFRVSPFTYLANVRIEKATQMLQFSEMPVADIADALGFEYPNSFIKAFSKAKGMPPSGYRAALK